MFRTRRRALTAFGFVLIFVLGFLIFFYFNFTSVVVSGDSMLPTLTSGRKVLVSKAYWLVGPIIHKSIVVIHGEKPGEYIIKRVYRLAGEQVDTLNVPETWPLSSGPFVVPPHSIYVLGDNREISEDSRKFGPVSTDRVIGKVVAY